MPLSLKPTESLLCHRLLSIKLKLKAKISLDPKHQLMVPSTLLAPATHIRTDKATKIHTLTPLTYELFFFKGTGVNKKFRSVLELVQTD